MRRLTLGMLALLAACSSGDRQEAAPAQRGGPLVYVTNEESGDLTVIDPAARQVIGRVALGKRPRGIVASPDGRTLYIALSGSPVGGPGVDESALPPPDKAADGIAVFDVDEGRVMRVLRGVSDPETIAVSPDGARLYVCSEDRGQLVVLDARDGQVIGQVAVGGEPEGVAVSPDGRTIVATSEEDGSAAVIDAGDLHVVRKVQVGQRPRNVLFSADGARAYIPGENDASLTAIDLRSGRVIRRATLPGQSVRPMGMAMAANAIFLSTGRGGELLRVDPESLAVAGRVHVGDRPWGLAASRDGRHLFTANGPSNDVAMVDSATMQVVARFAAGTKPWGVVSLA